MSQLENPRQILVVANETVVSKALVDLIEERAKGSDVVVTVIAPVEGVTSISAMPAQYALVRIITPAPRPMSVPDPVRRAPAAGEGRASHPAAVAVALRMSISRVSDV